MQVTRGTWCMHKQCVPGAFFSPPPHNSLGRRVCSGLAKECFIRLSAQVKVCFMSTHPSELYMANWRFEKHSPKCYVNLRQKTYVLYSKTSFIQTFKEQAPPSTWQFLSPQTVDSWTDQLTESYRKYFMAGMLCSSHVIKQTKDCYCTLLELQRSYKHQLVW